MSIVLQGVMICCSHDLVMICCSHDLVMICCSHDLVMICCSHDLVMICALTALHRITASLPHFLSPYLVDIILAVSTFPCHILHLNVGGWGHAIDMSRYIPSMLTKN